MTFAGLASIDPDSAACGVRLALCFAAYNQIGRS